MKSSSTALYAEHADYLLQLQVQYQANPESVDSSWRCVFEVLEQVSGRDSVPTGAASADLIAELLRSRGHLLTSLDPLGRAPPPPLTAVSPQLAHFVASDGTESKPAALIEQLKGLYGGTLAIESAHIDDPSVREWIARMVERPRVPEPEVLRAAMRTLVAAEEFERIMAVRFPGKKRFGAEGSEVLLPSLERVLVNAAKAGITDVVIGTMHRARLNTIGTVLRRPLEHLFAEFKGKYPFSDDRSAAADVPYHLGYETTLQIEGSSLAVTLCPNPSHLEAVNAVALGRARGRMDCTSDRRVLCVVLHTDASVIAQGVVAESVQMSRLAGFETGGTIHIIVNNQIGFTTEPSAARTSRYCTGAWKAIDSLILHVNGDYPETAIQAVDLAFEFREAQQRDGVVDLICYRRNGHNEVDEPRFTQPTMYQVIAEHAPVSRLYGARLVSAGVLTEQAIEALRADAGASLDRGFDAMSGDAQVPAEPPAPPEPPATEPTTGVPTAQLRQLLESMSAVPPDLSLDAKLARLVAQRLQATEAGVSWAIGEALAFASLLVEGTPVRLSGQDVVRGAFSHRHYALTDIITGRRYITLNALAASQARFEAVDSPLSEYGVLGFEYGYSVERPDALVVWEAQFGDFANGAQIVIDQFVTSSAEKWRQTCSLVVSLPHGLEGQGPEHSSARIERLLQLCARNNVDVAHPSTPANYFHLLRRQAHRAMPRPLFIIGAKTLLRLPAAMSPLAAFGPESAFQPVIASGTAGPVRRVLLCSGKIVYELEQERERQALTGCAVARIEMLYPFPGGALRALLEDWPRADVAWVQEEPRNQGAWVYMRDRIEELLADIGVAQPTLRCFSRSESTSPSGSFHGDHERDQKQLVQQAIHWAAEDND